MQMRVLNREVRVILEGALWRRVHLLVHRPVHDARTVNNFRAPE